MDAREAIKIVYRADILKVEFSCFVFTAILAKDGIKMLLNWLEIQK